MKKVFSTLNNLVTILLFTFFYLFKNPKHSWREQKAIRLIASIHPLIPKFFSRLRGLLKNKNKYKFDLRDKYNNYFSEINSCVSSLKNEGYYVFEQKLTADKIYEIKESLKQISTKKRLG